MAIEEREIGTDQVAIGMFVCRLDRPWTDTPFPLQGFLVTDIEQLATLREYCSRVWIDVELTRPAAQLTLARLERLTPRRGPARSRLHVPGAGQVRYVDTVTTEQERPAAAAAVDEARRIGARILDDVRAGRDLVPEDARLAAEPIVASVLRNADALFWVNALRAHDAYSYSHAINCSALAAAFGRHLGLPREMLVRLACGALLFDIGKTRVPVDILDKPGPLNPLEMARARRHVELGLQILNDGGEQDPIVREMMAGHHERFDGSGYPQRLRDPAIPVYARIAGIVDSFDAMTSDRPHARAMQRYDALQELYRGRDTLYHGELVEQFISCLGVYPTGSLVELNTGEVAVVLAQNPSRRLRPRLMLLTDADKRLREGFASVDLMDQPLDTPALEIRRPVAPDEYGIDLTELYL
ncbi:MAG: HD-GYP domain-containing protein [Pseudomonadota bacterium]